VGGSVLEFEPPALRLIHRTVKPAFIHRESIAMRDAIWLPIMVLTLALISGIASADSDGPDSFRVIGVAKRDTLNIRAQPNARAPKVGEIPPDGTCIQNLDCQGGLTFQEFTDLSSAEQKKRERENPRWCKVEYRGIIGWVAGRYLAEGDCDR
jgi:hypothetical protein